MDVLGIQQGFENYILSILAFCLYIQKLNK